MKKYTFFIVFLFILVFSVSTLSDTNNPNSPTSGKTATVAEVKDYFIDYIKNEMHIDIGSPDDYCITVSITAGFADGEFYFSTVEYYDRDSESQKKIQALITMDLGPAESLYGKVIGWIRTWQEPYTEEEWEKYKRMCQKLGGWRDCTKDVPYWNYTQKYEFYQSEGWFPSAYVTAYIYDDLNHIKTGDVVLPRKDEMQYDEALQYAWKMFHNQIEFTGNPDDIMISSVCIRKTKEAIQKAKMRYPDIGYPDDGLVWIFQFYLPERLDNGETIYRLLLHTGGILENNLP